MKREGFTLIELLVTIAIIALLLAIVMPSLRRARGQVRGVYCRNNLKQMFTASQTYAFNQDDYYPIAHYMREVQQGPIENLNEAHTENSQSGTALYSYAWDFTTYVSDQRQQVLPGTLWQGDTIEKIQQCPSYKGQDNWTGMPFTGYNYNTSYIGHGQGEQVSGAYQGRVLPHPDWPFYEIVMSIKTVRVKNNGMCALFGEGHYAGGANKFMRSPWRWDGDYDFLIRAGGTQGFRHNDRTNIVWCDGHVSSQSTRHADAIDRVKTSLEEYNRNAKVKIGFLSSDNSLYDLK